MTSLLYTKHCLIQAYIHIQLPVYCQHQNSYHPVELIRLHCKWFPVASPKGKDEGVCNVGGTRHSSEVPKVGQTLFACLGGPYSLSNRNAVKAETPRQPCVSTVGQNDPETPRKLPRSLGLPESVTRPFHPFLRDDIKWKQ